MCAAVQRIDKPPHVRVLESWPEGRSTAEARDAWLMCPGATKRFVIGGLPHFLVKDILTFAFLLVDALECIPHDSQVNENARRTR